MEMWARPGFPVPVVPRSPASVKRGQGPPLYRGPLPRTEQPLNQVARALTPGILGDFSRGGLTQRDVFYELCL